MSATESSLARSTDPGTSHAAAASVEVTRLEGIILDQLRAHGPATSYALAEKLKMSLVTVSPRLRPLSNKGLIRDSGIRAVGPSKRSQIVWAAVRAS